MHLVSKLEVGGTYESTYVVVYAAIAQYRRADANEQKPEAVPVLRIGLVSATFVSPPASM